MGVKNFDNLSNRPLFLAIFIIPNHKHMTGNIDSINSILLVAEDSISLLILILLIVLYIIPTIKKNPNI